MAKHGRVAMFFIIREQNLIFCSKALWPRVSLFLRHKIDLCPKRSKSVQIGSLWSQMARNQLDWPFGINLDHFRPVWENGKLVMAGHFWFQSCLFGSLRAHNWRMAMAETASNQFHIYLKIMQVQQIPKVSIFITVTTNNCQRHNGPEGWAHITSSNTNPDQISSSESRPSINFKVSTKHLPLHKM